MSEVPFYYALKIRVLRNSENNSIEPFEKIQNFIDPNPIIARENAFKAYQTFVDIFLEDKGLKVDEKDSINDDMSRTILEPHFNDYFESPRESSTDEKFAYYFHGIAIYLVKTTEPIAKYMDRELLIHGIGNIVPVKDYFTDHLTINLEEEYTLYCDNGFDIADYKDEFMYYDRGEYEDGYEDGQPMKIQILKTPFDWTGYDKPWWSENNQLLTPEPEILNNHEILIKSISMGESSLVEFKPNLLYYYDSNYPENSGYRNYTKYLMAKVICSFLNAEGGVLYIGVNDDGTIKGLDEDYSLRRPANKDPFDYLQNEISNFLKTYFKHIVDNIKVEFLKVEGKDVLAFVVYESQNFPIFIKGHKSDEKEFYVRMATSTIKYDSIEDIVMYCLGKWGKNFK